MTSRSDFPFNFLKGSFVHHCSLFPSRLSPLFSFRFARLNLYRHTGTQEWWKHFFWKGLSSGPPLHVLKVLDRSTSTIITIPPAHLLPEPLQVLTTRLISPNVLCSCLTHIFRILVTRPNRSVSVETRGFVFLILLEMILCRFWRTGGWRMVGLSRLFVELMKTICIFDVQKSHWSKVERQKRMTMLQTLFF